jgi:cytochrome o ubiquinol oxidase subunit 2
VPIHFVLTSASVMNVFFIPQLGTMIYTMNGMANRLNLIADHAGTYYGQSAMISGDGFPTMHFDVDAVSAEQFAAWVNKTKADGPTLDRRTYGELARQSMSVQPFTYRTVEPDLFRKIVTQDVPPGPGPGTSAAQSISDKAHGG